MPRKGHSDEQILHALRQAESGHEGKRELPPASIASKRRRFTSGRRSTLASAWAICRSCVRRMANSSGWWQPLALSPHSARDRAKKL